jgi:hypothetical protein
MNLLALADGFGDDIAAPPWYPRYFKWPKIIQLMTKNVVVNNVSRYGAGNEYLVTALRDNIQTADMVLLQWAVPDRLDLVLNESNTHWQDTIKSDAIYNNNTIDSGKHKFWLSSGSKTADVVEYHKKYISKQQHQLRSQLFVDYAKLLIDQHQLAYRFMLTWDSAYLENNTAVDINWCWHKPFKGMHDFRNHSKFSELDLDIVQPIPLIHFDFIKQFIMPCVDLPWRSNQEIDAVESMLYRHYQESIANRPNDTN